MYGQVMKDSIGVLPTLRKKPKQQHADIPAVPADMFFHASFGAKTRFGKQPDGGFVSFHDPTEYTMQSYLHEKILQKQL
jgi:hypothetical protein